LSQSNRILLIFAGLFVVAAAIIYIAYPGQNKHSETPIPPMGEMPDSLMNIEMAKINQLKQALESDPKNLDHLIQLGNIYFDINRTQEAIGYYERALAIDSLNPHVLTDCGIMYSQSGDLDKALRLFDKAIAIDPNLLQAYYNKGLILYSGKKDKPNAIKAWRQYIALLTDTAQANEFKHLVDSLETGL
jgi:tetratricopeptide (TPR) repeat protein